MSTSMFFRSWKCPPLTFHTRRVLSLSEGRTLLGILLKDPRVRIIEVSEYAALRDLDQLWVNKLVDLLADGLKR